MVRGPRNSVLCHQQRSALVRFLNLSDLIVGSSWQEASHNRLLSIITVPIVFAFWPKLKLSHLADLNLVRILFEKNLPKVDWDKRSSPT
ncbi:MAG: hypothetical protein CBC19_00005 [Oceanospirillales bacterium TMED59]|nr:MAG: hypothetical protein CBC19_00005 [Oceanospirillales bacterium TMED59]